jgi:hypothetical protein
MKSRKRALSRSSSGVLLFLMILIPFEAAAQQSGKSDLEELDRFWNIERSNIERVAQFTATHGGAILFSIDRTLGYASAGKARRLNLPPYSFRCPYWSASLSQDGRLVAFLNGEADEHCGLSIYEIGTGKSKSLIDLSYAPATLLWSWDDTEISFGDSRFNSASIQSVSVSDGSVRTIVSAGQLAMDKTPAGILTRFDDSAPMQFARGKQVGCGV